MLQSTVRVSASLDNVSLQNLFKTFQDGDGYKLPKVKLESGLYEASGKVVTLETDFGALELKIKLQVNWLIYAIHICM